MALLPRIQKELPFCRSPDPTGGRGSHGYNCFDEKFSPGSRSRRDLFYLRPCKSLTYIISTSPETWVISKDLEVVTEVLPPPSSRPRCKLHLPLLPQIISLWCASSSSTAVRQWPSKQLSPKILLFQLNPLIIHNPPSFFFFVHLNARGEDLPLAAGSVISWLESLVVLWLHLELKLKLKCQYNWQCKRLNLKKKKKYS